MKKRVILFSIIFFGWCFAALAQNFNVTFQVDMSVQIGKKLFDPAADKIQARGSFNAWGTTDMAPISAGSKIYSVKIAVPSGPAAYKFYFKHGTTEYWESDQATASKNRETAVSADVVLPVVFFNNEAMPSGAKATVKFIADMRGPLKKGDINKATGKVFAAGDFNGWSTTKTELKDTKGDSTYSAIVDTIKSGQLINYKFLYDKKAGGTQWEDDPNKTAWIVDGAQDVRRFFNDVDPTTKTADGAIGFTVDMSVMKTVNLFDPAKDTLLVMGGFNGWSASDKSKSVMNQNPVAPTSFFNSIAFVKQEVNSDQFYKFKVIVRNQTGPLGGDAGYERPFSTGGGNRTVKFLGQTSQDAGKVSFNDINPAFVVPSGTTVTANFAVDMTDAMDAVKQPIPFDPAKDTVYLVPGQAAWAAIMGWKEGQDRAIKLTRDGSTNVWKGSASIKGPAFNGFVYVYEFAKPAPDGMQKETTGFSNWAWRVRYIPMTASQKFVQPYTAVVDKWAGKTEVKAASEYETWPKGLSSVEELGNGIPTTFELAQNYPNPFNPTTNIKFTLPSDEMVSLKVYNVLGQEVATLLNQQMKAGSYKTDFNASKLSSGVYFYRLEAGSFNTTKKMMLIK